MTGPTWRNIRTGDARVAKRLDRFLLIKDPENSLTLLKQWIGTGGDSDHFPIFLDLKGTYMKLISPFRFNLEGFKFLAYNVLVKRTWSSVIDDQD